jgi:peptidyl-prolyl cis-trans isomerase B (cyclophilin B)
VIFAEEFTMKATRIICALLALVCICTVICSCGYKAPTGKAAYDADNSPTRKGTEIKMSAVKEEIDSMKVSDFVPSSQQSDYVLIKIKDYGEIVVALRHDVAPITVENFKRLVAEGFYTDTVFHRVIEGFMIQGGGCIVAPEGSKDYFAYKEADSINGEFTSNGFVNNLTHVRGVISMARAGAPSQATNEQIKEANNSASSQFFIVHQTGDSARSLNGDYATFGYVLAGMDVVDAIATCQVFDPESNAPVPVQDVVIESIAFVEPK